MAASKRLNTTAEEELRMFALRLADSHYIHGPSTRNTAAEAVVKQAQTYYDFLSGTEAPK